MQPNNRQKAVIALKKAKTSVEKIIKMLDEDKYCIDVIQQILAAQGLLKSAQMSMLKNHLNSCFKTAFETKNKTKEDEMIAELVRVLEISQKK